MISGSRTSLENFSSFDIQPLLHGAHTFLTVQSGPMLCLVTS